jgi:hypothetical protein
VLLIDPSSIPRPERFLVMPPVAAWLHRTSDKRLETVFY